MSGWAQRYAEEAEERAEAEAEERAGRRNPFIPGGTPKVANGVCTAAYRFAYGEVFYCDLGEIAHHAANALHGADAPGGRLLWRNDEVGAGSSS